MSIGVTAMRARRWYSGVAVAAAACLGGAVFVLGAAAIRDQWSGASGSGGGAAWREIAWPFPRDAWPPGRAFRCAAADCGSEVELYVRPKLGFCNCTVGVADDAEVDRVADLDLISQRFVPLGSGESIRFAAMPGRARPYNLQLPDGVAHPAIGLAAARGCDVVVAVIRGSAAPQTERQALDWLSSPAMAKWIDTALEGG
jgi:hypothetical protein